MSKKEQVVLSKSHWKQAKRIWNTLSLSLGTRRTNQTYTEKVIRNED